MRLIVSMLLTAGLSYYMELYLPWWIVAIVPALVCMLLRLGVLQAFISGFLGIGVLWLCLAWRIHVDSGGVLSNKVTMLFGLSDPLQLVLSTGLVGGLVGGLAAINGSVWRNFFTGKRKNRSTYEWR